MLKQYIEFFYPGSFVSETTFREVFDRTPPADTPARAYGYRFFARNEVECDGEKLTGDRKEYSPTTYFGETLTLADVLALTPPGDYKILVSNMRNNGWERVVRTVRGQFMPLEPCDVVLPPKKEILK